MRPHIIGIAGPSSSGKSELSRQLVLTLPGTSIVSLDSYYCGMQEIPLAARKTVNFDHPGALDWELLHEHLQAMASGRTFEEPVYSFADYARTSATRLIEPSEFIIVEGLFVLYWAELRSMLDTKVYVETDAAVCFSRRLRARRRRARAHAAIRARTVPADGPAERRVVCRSRPRSMRTSWFRAKSRWTIRHRPSSTRSTRQKPLPSDRIGKDRLSSRAGSLYPPAETSPAPTVLIRSPFRVQ